MKKTILKKILSNLEEQKNLLLAKPANHSVDDFNSGDEVDMAQGLIINEMMEKLSLRDKESLKKLSEAIQRVNDGSYGLCEDCEEPISEKRLLALPLCTNCIDCAEQREKMAKQYRK